MVFWCYAKVVEDQDKHKKVIHTERFFDQVAGQKLHRGLFPPPIIDYYIKYQCQGNPEETGPQSFLDFNFVGFAVEYEKIKSQHQEDENIEYNPEIDIVHEYVDAPRK